MATEARILADSVNPYNGKRLTTFYLKYPRIIHSEFMTHRMIARNAKSSRAMSIEKMIKEVQDDPFIPNRWPVASKTMHNSEWLDSPERIFAEVSWLNARNNAVKSAERLANDGVHKQIVNRLLEPWMYIEVIASATEWNNFFELRRSDFAQPEFKLLADNMFNEISNNDPIETIIHNPGVYDRLTTSIDNKNFIIANCGSIARVSYGKSARGTDIAIDLELGERLLENRHMSPFEHVAVPVDNELLCDEVTHPDELYSLYKDQFPYDSCIKGWITARWMIEHKKGYFA